LATVDSARFRGRQLAKGGHRGTVTILPGGGTISQANFPFTGRQAMGIGGPDLGLPRGRNRGTEGEM